MVVFDHAEMAGQIRLCLGPVSIVPATTDVIHAGKHQARVSILEDRVCLVALTGSCVNDVTGLHWG
jgi:hypothetical protein